MKKVRIIMMSKNFFVLLFILIICIIFTGGQYEVFSKNSNNNEMKAGKFNYMPEGCYANKVTEKVLENPYIVGILISTSWRDIERREGDFDWSNLDNYINLANAAGKVVTLNLFAGGRNTPDWVKQLPEVQLYSFVDTNMYHSTYCEEDTMPVFWDPIFLEKKMSFIKAAGQRYANNENVVGVMVSFASANTNDMYVPHKVGFVCGQQINQVQDWLDVGYTTEKMLNAGKKTISAWAAAFPNQALKLPIGLTDSKLDGTVTKLAELIVDFGYSAFPDRFFAQMNGLCTLTPYADDPLIINACSGDSLYIMKLLFEHRPQIGLQMLAGASNGDKDNCRLNGRRSPCYPRDVLLESVGIAISYDPHFIEYWHIDAENIELQSVLEYVNNILNSINYTKIINPRR